MARTRRKAYARTRLNLEIVGIAAAALAVFCGIALAFPHAAGAVGGWTASLLRHLFGGMAPIFPVLVALFGAIVFLEVNVPRMIAGLGTTVLAYFLILVGMFGSGGVKRGGIIGSNIWWALHALVGNVGAWIVLSVALLSLTIWLTNASLKQLIGRVIVFFGGLRSPQMPKLPSFKVPQGHESLREAFALPNVILSPSTSLGVNVVEGPAQPVVTIEPESPKAAPLEVESPKAGPVEIVPSHPSTELRMTRGVDAPTRIVFRIWRSSTCRRVRRLTNRTARTCSKIRLRVSVSAQRSSHIERGPSITRYELKPERGVKISRIAALADDLALRLPRRAFGSRRRSPENPP